MNLNFLNIHNRLNRYILFFLITFFNPAFAWNNTGHRLVADIAYSHLTAKTKQEVKSLLDILQPFYWPTTHSTHALFRHASVWPDQIKYQKNPCLRCMALH